MSLGYFCSFYPKLALCNQICLYSIATVQACTRCIKIGIVTTKLLCLVGPSQQNIFTCSYCYPTHISQLVADAPNYCMSHF
jgi:hypothetical protein